MGEEGSDEKQTSSDFRSSGRRQSAGPGKRVGSSARLTWRGTLKRLEEEGIRQGGVFTLPEMGFTA
jgi:hypothetical protein